MANKPRFNLATTLSRVDTRAEAWADRGSNRAARLHRNAPRGGSNLNAFGRYRSAGGEPPAVEFGTLLRKLEAPPERDGAGYAFAVNYAPLEYGARLANGGIIEPRPLGLRVSNELKQRGKQGRGP